MPSQDPRGRRQFDTRHRGSLMLERWKKPSVSVQGSRRGLLWRPGHIIPGGSPQGLKDAENFTGKDSHSLGVLTSTLVAALLPVLYIKNPSVCSMKTMSCQLLDFGDVSWVTWLGSTHRITRCDRAAPTVLLLAVRRRRYVMMDPVPRRRAGAM